MNLRDRIGFDAGANRLEDALEWAVAHGFYHLDFNADIGPNHLEAWARDRVRAVRQTCDRNGVHLGLHTLSLSDVFSLYTHIVFLRSADVAMTG